MIQPKYYSLLFASLSVIVAVIMPIIAWYLPDSSQLSWIIVGGLGMMTFVFVILAMTSSVNNRAGSRNSA